MELTGTSLDFLDNVLSGQYNILRTGGRLLKGEPSDWNGTM